MTKKIATKRKNGKRHDASIVRKIARATVETTATLGGSHLAMGAGCMAPVLTAQRWATRGHMGKDALEAAIRRAGELGSYFLRHCNEHDPDGQSALAEGFFREALALTRVLRQLEHAERNAGPRS